MNVNPTQGIHNEEIRMHIVLGGTGHVGAALAMALLDRGEEVTIVCRNESKALNLQRRGARVAVVDVGDVDGLRRVFSPGHRVFVLNPPANPALDIDAEERKTIAAIVSALDGAEPDRIVAASTYGAQSGAHLADLGSLYEMEQALAKLPGPVSIIRGAYYMSNWDTELSSARESGVVNTFFPSDFKLPMVEPVDLANMAAKLMTGRVATAGMHHMEGPERYSANDVARAFAHALGRPVAAAEIPRGQWSDVLKHAGFSDRAAASFGNSFAATLAATFPGTDDVLHGPTSLESHIAQSVAQLRSGPGAALR